jgi:O-antigen/teichoic acid export membrane protein
MMETADHLSSSRVVVRSGIYNIAGFLASALYMIVLVPVATHFLGREQYGLWTAVLALTGYIGLADLGLSTSFVTYIARYVALGDLKAANRVVTHGLLFYVLVSSVMLIVSMIAYPVFFDFLNIKEADWATARSALYLSVALFAMTSVAGVYGSILAAVQRMDAFNLQFVGLLAVKFSFTCAALMAGYGVGGVFVADLTATMLSIPVVMYLAKRSVPGLILRWDGYDRALMRTLLKFGSRLQVSRVADIVQMSFDKLLLTRYLGFSATAMYDYGSRPINRLRTLPVTAISSLIPAVSALDAHDNDARIRAAVVRSTRYLVLIAVPLFSLCVLFAQRLMTLWIGPGNELAAYTLQVLSVGSCVAVVMSALSLVSLGKGEPEFQMRTTLVQAILNLILSTVLVMHYGFMGAVTGTTISMIVGGVLFFYTYGRRVMDAPFRLLGTTLLRPIASVIPALLGAFLVAALGDHLNTGESRFVGVVVLGVACLVFVAVYAAFVRLTGAFTADDMGFLRNALPHKMRSPA